MCWPGAPSPRWVTGVPHADATPNSGQEAERSCRTRSCDVSNSERSRISRPRHGRQQPPCIAGVAVAAKRHGTMAVTAVLLPALLERRPLRVRRGGGALSQLRSMEHLALSERRTGGNPGRKLFERRGGVSGASRRMLVARQRSLEDHSALTREKPVQLRNPEGA